MTNDQLSIAGQKIAVIDIGSNSVRMVVYDGLKRVPLPLFNEKVLCGLGKGMNKTGRLNPEGIEAAERAIARFALIAQSMKVTRVIALATAAVRDASDGKSFAETIRNKYRLDVKIISGEEEARLSCLGVLESIFDARGVVGDLGGGSLELSYINSDKKDFGGYRSFPIGPLRLKNRDKQDYKKAAEIIDEYILSWPHLKMAEGRDFYAVGGGFRALAKIHMANSEYPLRVLHNYSVPVKKLEETLDDIAGTSPTYLKKFPFISENRRETMALTALIANRLIKHLKPERMIFSVHGIREGYLFDQLSEKIKSEDPLLTGCSDMIERTSPEPKSLWTKFGYELFDWMSPLFPEEKSGPAKLRLAACILSRLAWYEHAEYRAGVACRLILDAAISGIGHEARVFIATAVYHRYKTVFESSGLARPVALIEKKEIAAAKTVGLAARLGIGLSGGALGVLRQAPLVLEKNRLAISPERRSESLVGEPVRRRFYKLAESLDLKPEIRI